MMRILVRLVAVAVLLALAPVVMALAQPAPIDKAYESSKSAELESVKLQLATRQDSRGVGELNEAESALRRLRETKAADQRAKIAAELDSALARLHLVADGVGK
ncbi:hypothetical protein CCC_02572 [Paramagnetospirillum magnetotacticum MS-1]|uniref:Uncharacterized protein n=1 Tax=Paramagnetospirillum magnetotacticum MS-1 TaxID=272627 RepID=A0A0C2YXG0_PARME|nr:hypothetical protein [Paramagnetospirillum magnetotacticum]KIL99353.1 hypothetical protein CCC_04124 [Paramagnetospirillum magnetotacticum MS-1]KIL99793.1 hypothetical protein CCC_02572 [Paramagnetospirillum magnetotacticum MS-1]